MAWDREKGEEGEVERGRGVCMGERGRERKRKTEMLRSEKLTFQCKVCTKKDMMLLQNFKVQRGKKWSGRRRRSSLSHCMGLAGWPATANTVSAS